VRNECGDKGDTLPRPGVLYRHGPRRRLNAHRGEKTREGRNGTRDSGKEASNGSDSVPPWLVSHEKGNNNGSKKESCVEGDTTSR